MPKQLAVIILVATGLPALVAGLIALARPGRVEAVPAFARQYDLQCNACHTRPPRLNRFGEQFHMMGFQIPSAAQPGGIVSSVRDDGPVKTLIDSLALRIEGGLFEYTESPGQSETKFVPPDEITLFVARPLLPELSRRAWLPEGCRGGEGGVTSGRRSRTTLERAPGGFPPEIPKLVNGAALRCCARPHEADGAAQSAIAVDDAEERPSETRASVYSLRLNRSLSNSDFPQTFIGLDDVTRQQGRDDQTCTLAVIDSHDAEGQDRDEDQNMRLREK